jgi:hypothetical protein
VPEEGKPDYEIRKTFEDGETIKYTNAEEETFAVTDLIKTEMDHDNGQIERSELSCDLCSLFIGSCKASLIVHKKKKHSIDPIKQSKPSKQLQRRTLKDRTYDFLNFLTYVTGQTGKVIEEVMATPDGREIMQELFFGYFTSYRLKDGKQPTPGYLLKLRSSVVLSLISEYRLDLSRRDTCPDYTDRWRAILVELGWKGPGVPYSDLSTS